MKKTRNSFFSESNFQTFNPNMNPAPYQMASNYFYQQSAPNTPMNNQIPNNYNTMNTMNTMNINNDLESRLAKIERQLNRLDYRLTKVENSTNVISSDDFDTNNSNMYML